MVVELGCGSGHNLAVLAARHGATTIGIDRDSADEVFAKRKAETEDAPDDWRNWFRLAVAYHDARDTPRARKAMQRAIALHDGRPVQA